MSEGPRQFGLGLGVVVYTIKDIIRPGRFQHSNPCMYLKENPTGPWTGFSTIRKSCPMGTWPRAKPLLGHACLELSRGRAACSNWNLDSWLDPISVPGFAEVLWGLERILVTSGNGKFLFWAGRKPDVECATVNVDPSSHGDGSLQMRGLIKANWLSGFKWLWSPSLVACPHHKWFSL